MAGVCKGEKFDQSIAGLEKNSYPDLIPLANPYWHYSCNFTVTESSVDNEDLLYCPSASEHSLSSLMVIVMFIALPAMTVERKIYIMINQPNNNSLSLLTTFYLQKINHIFI